VERPSRLQVLYSFFFLDGESHWVCFRHLILYAIGWCRREVRVFSKVLSETSFLLGVLAATHPSTNILEP